MRKTIFKHINLGETLPINNVHSVSVSMPKLQDVIDYEKLVPKVLDKIKSAYPRFMIHPYLKILANFIKDKYNIPNDYEVVLLNSKEDVQIFSKTYYINNKIDINEPFGVILLIKDTCQLQKVLSFIQYIGCNLSSRFAEDYLYKNKLINTIQKEISLDKNIAKNSLLKYLSSIYEQKIENICLTPSGMNAIYCVLKALKNIQRRNSRNIFIQFGWLYLDTMNIIKEFYNENKIFYDIDNLDILEDYLKQNGFNVCSIITEIPTNPLLQCVDLERLKQLCIKYNIPLIIDCTISTPLNIDFKKYADIYIESLTKFACGNADVLMGCFILNENSKISHIKNEFFKHTSLPYIRDIQRLAYEIQDYKVRISQISSNTVKLIKYLKKCSYVKKVYHCMQEENKDNYKKLMRTNKSYSGLISLSFTKDFKSVYDKLNFPKGPSLGTNFTLLMPYVYLAHYDLIICKEGQELLKMNNIPIDLLRVSVGTENIDDIIGEFKRIENLL